MPALCTFLLALLSMVVVAPQARAVDLHLHLPELQLAALPAAPAGRGVAANLALASEATLAPASAPAPSLQSDREEHRLRRRRTGAGFGVATGLGLIVGGVITAAQTRPNNGDSTLGICYDSDQEEKTFLYAATGVMSVGLVLSSSMLAWLLTMRHAHPEIRPSTRKRGMQALVGIGAAGISTMMLMMATFGCKSS